MDHENQRRRDLGTRGEGMSRTAVLSTEGVMPRVGAFACSCLSHALLSSSEGKVYG